jgi:hypothetical protein
MYWPPTSVRRMRARRFRISAVFASPARSPRSRRGIRVGAYCVA